MSREQIVRDTAYAIWQAEGKPEGRDTEHWRLAEEHVATSAGDAAGAKKPAKGVSATPSAKPKPTVPARKAATAPTKPAKGGPKSKA
jgi:hypothetical protein